MGADASLDSKCVMANLMTAQINLRNKEKYIGLTLNGYETVVSDKA